MLPPVHFLALVAASALQVFRYPINGRPIFRPLATAATSRTWVITTCEILTASATQRLVLHLTDACWEGSSFVGFVDTCRCRDLAKHLRQHQLQYQ